MTLAVIGLAACSSPAPVLRGSAPPARAVTEPAPTIAWDGQTLVAKQLPAVARNSELVVLPIVDNDSARGYPNLRIDLRTREDRTTRTLAVMTPNEYEALVPDGTTPSAELTARLDATNRALAQLHAEHDLVALPEVTDVVVDPAKWPAPQGQRCAQCPPCENPPFLRRAYRAPEQRVTVVVIGYRGTDACWEPSDQLHVLTK